MDSRSRLQQKLLNDEQNGNTNEDVKVMLKRIEDKLDIIIVNEKLASPTVIITLSLVIGIVTGILGEIVVAQLKPNHSRKGKIVALTLCVVIIVVAIFAANRLSKHIVVA